MPAAYIYVLHFDRPLAHARHYIGATWRLRRRLIRHAQGRAARITQVLLERGIEWQVARVLNIDTTPTIPTSLLFARERQAKKQHQGARYCPICGGQTRLDDATEIDLDLLTFPIRSELLRQEEENDQAARPG